MHRNPQQDLQAQDRCHRLGQKKPVTVFRLVSENTVEEKIVERAQQKLKLDAMVVQQGRLKEKDKVSKDEIMAAVRFGADTIFRSEESTITDDDIDVILERGKAKTKELAEKIQKAEKGDLLDFRLDGGVATQTFEGIDYSDKELRDHLRMLAANSVGKRERRPPPTSYVPIMQAKKSMIVNNQHVKLPMPLRLPQMEDHHFYNRERLLELDNLEFENYAILKEKGQLPPKDVMESRKTLLPPDLAREKLELIGEGFGNWSRSQYFHFIKSCAKFGRDDISNIATDMDLPEDVVVPYSKAFWKYGPTELKSDWERVIGTVERGERRLLKQKKLTAMLTQFVRTFDDPRNEMVFANKGTTHFSLEQDRALLFSVEKYGYGNWDLVREEIRNDGGLKFQHSVQGMSVQAIAKRCDYRMRQMERELELREKMMKSKRPANVVAAQKLLDGVKAMDTWETLAREAELEGLPRPPTTELPDVARTALEDRLKDRATNVTRLREIEVQVQRCFSLAEDTRKAIMRGDQYVNYSNITLKSGGPGATGKDGKSGQTMEDSIAMEASINPLVLKVPVCGMCENCQTNTKLCIKRLDVRDSLLSTANRKRLGAGLQPSLKKTKKRKNDTISIPAKPAQSSPDDSSSPSESAKKKKKLMMKQADGKLKVRVTSQGNKRMMIPDEVFPEFCRRIGQGTGNRVQLINQFVEDYPTISARQVTLKFAEVCARNRPECVEPESAQKKKKMGRTFMFYLRPCYYKHLNPEQRPNDWETYAAADEVLRQKEELERKEKKEANGSSNVSPSPDSKANIPHQPSSQSVSSTAKSVASSGLASHGSLPADVSSNSEHEEMDVT